MLGLVGLLAVLAAWPKWASAAFGWKVLFALADFVANQRTGSGTANGSKRATKDGISGYTAKHCASARADLCIGGVGSAASQSNQGCSCGRHQNFRDHGFHLFCLEPG